MRFLNLAICLTVFFVSHISSFVLTPTTPLSAAIAAIKALPEGVAVEKVGPATISYSDMQALWKSVADLGKATKANAALWVDKSRPSEKTPYFLQKLLVPGGSRIAVVGDLHGDAQALCSVLEHLKNEKLLNESWQLLNNAGLILLGDYEDIGPYSTEVWYMASRMKLANPERTVLLRGDHEDEGAKKAEQFVAELDNRYTTQKGYLAVVDLLNSVYATLPCAVFIGVAHDRTVDYIQCSHGGVEFGFFPHRLLASGARIAYQAVPLLYRATNVRVLGIKPGVGSIDRVADTQSDIGYVWCMFDMLKGAGAVPGKASLYSESLTANILRASSHAPYYGLHAVYRCHQHDEPFLSEIKKHNGVMPIWGGLVTTIVSCLSLPAYGGASNGYAFVMITAAPNNKWNAKMVLSGRKIETAPASQVPVKRVRVPLSTKPLETALAQSKTRAGKLLTRRAKLAKNLQILSAHVEQLQADLKKPENAAPARQAALKKQLSDTRGRRRQATVAYNRFLAAYKRELRQQLLLRRKLRVIQPAARPVRATAKKVVAQPVAVAI